MSAVVTVIRLDDPGYYDVRGGHVHRCPECFEDAPCEDTCTVHPDQERDDGTPAGAVVACERCSAIPAAAAVHGMPACGCVLTFVCRRCQREICACAGADDAALDLCDECAAAERQRRGDIDGR